MQAQHEVVVATTDELRPGELREVAVGDDKLLLARVGDEVFALGATCPHLGAPLAEGLLHGERLICPWHHACFAVRSGALLEPPGLDGLPRYEARIVGEQVRVRLPANLPSRQQASFAARDAAADERTFAIVGAGAAGSAAAEMLRQQGFQGRVVLLSDEARLPYDRTLLSKEYLARGDDMDSMPVRDYAFYEQRGIELRLGQPVAAIDVHARTLRLADNTTLPYDALLLAPGSKSVPLDVPGGDYAGVHTLRRPPDADAIREGAGPVVVVGASFIAMEGASALRQRGYDVTVVAPDAVPFERVLGREIGAQLQRLHEQNGVRFCLNEKVVGIEGKGKVKAVLLRSGRRLTAGTVLVGIGVTPATELVNELVRDAKHGVPVDAQLQVEGLDGRVFAAGDIARYPEPRLRQQVRIEHWRVAAQQGRVAACNMLGQGQPFDKVPLFWSAQHNKGFYYVGHAPTWDEVVIHGNASDEQLMAYYLKNGALVAALGSGRNRDMVAIEECMRLDRLPALAQLRADSVDWPAQARGG